MYAKLRRFVHERKLGPGFVYAFRFFGLRDSRAHDEFRYQPHQRIILFAVGWSKV
jgi:hypothetical protein